MIYDGKPPGRVPTIMSDFTNLRKARHTKEHLKSYVSRAPSEHDEAVQASLQLAKGGKLRSRLSAMSNGLYATWPTSRFDIRIADEDPLRGRGVFSRERYRPGKSAFVTDVWHNLFLQTQDDDFFFLL